MSSRVIWQYWETVGYKPPYIDGLHNLARKNAGTEVILVTPETLNQFLSHIPPEIFHITEIAHKADMIRAMLVQQHGGMWLDPDAIVLSRLDWIFDLLDTYEFVCFNDNGVLEGGDGVYVCCFASRPGGRIVSEWTYQQHAKFPRTKFDWEEIGRDLLRPICLSNRELVKVLRWEEIAPMNWDEVAKFTSRGVDASTILRDCCIVMLYNQAFKLTDSPLRTMTIEQIASGDYLLSAIMRHAMHV